MRKEHDACSMDGCDRPHKARGYCQTHYMQFKRGITPIGPIRSRVSEKPPECEEADCSAPVKAKGLCRTHYQRLLRHGHTMYRDRKTEPKPCSIASCDNHAYAKGLCHAHYLKQRKWQAQGIDAARYQEMLAEQNGICAVCHKPETRRDGTSGKVRDLAIDHDHTTGAIRALLCSSCNRGLGLFQDSADLLGKAVAYLEKHKA